MYDPKTTELITDDLYLAEIPQCPMDSWSFPTSQETISKDISDVNHDICVEFDSQE